MNALTETQCKQLINSNFLPAQSDLCYVLAHTTTICRRASLVSFTLSFFRVHLITMLDNNDSLLGARSTMRLSHVHVLNNALNGELNEWKTKNTPSTPGWQGSALCLLGSAFKTLMLTHEIIQYIVCHASCGFRPFVQYKLQYLFVICSNMLRSRFGKVRCIIDCTWLFDLFTLWTPYDLRTKATIENWNVRIQMYQFKMQSHLSNNQFRNVSI